MMSHCARINVILLLTALLSALLLILELLKEVVAGTLLILGHTI